MIFYFINFCVSSTEIILWPFCSKICYFASQVPTKVGVFNSWLDLINWRKKTCSRPAWRALSRKPLWNKVIYTKVEWVGVRFSCLHAFIQWRQARAGWIFHPSTSLGSFGSYKQAALYMQARKMHAHSFYLGIDDFGLHHATASNAASMNGP